MKKIIVVMLSMFVPCNLMASPLSDVLMGGVMMIVGGVFEVQRGKAASDKDEANTKVMDHSLKMLDADENYWYYYGAAQDYRYWFGTGGIYSGIVGIANGYANTANSEATQTIKYSNDYSDASNKEKIYKGVSLTSFGVGSFFIVKGVVTYFYQKNHPKPQSAKANKNYEWSMIPAQTMDGANVQWSYKWGS